MYIIHLRILNKLQLKKGKIFFISVNNQTILSQYRRIIHTVTLEKYIEFEISIENIQCVQPSPTYAILNPECFRKIFKRVNMIYTYDWIL